MNILFVDVDGVLNSKQHFLMTERLSQAQLDEASDPALLAMKHDTNKMNMWCLKYILDNVPDLKIVISSSWRNHYSLEQFAELFKIYGLDGTRIIGKTPKKFSSQRVHEIHMWLDDNTPEGNFSFPGSWVALDDHVIFNLEDKQNEILTDSWMGLTLPDAIKIIKHFKPDFKEPVMMV